MPRQLLANVRVHLLYYRRNRLLLLIAVILAAVCLMTLIPSLFFRSSSQRFELAKMIFDALNFYFFLFAAALGLIGASGHLRDRSIKMVLTKPVAPELWLLSHWLAAALVLVGLVAMNLALVTTLFLSWGVPLQNGMAYLGLSVLCRCLILFSYLTFLSILMHPALAGVLVLLLQQETFYQLGLLTASAQGLSGAGLYRSFLGIVRQGLLLIYKVLPVYDPYPGALGRVSSSFRIEAGDLPTLLLTALYAVAISSLFYLLATASVRRRRLV